MRLESAFSWSIIRICISASAIDLYQGDYVQIVTENGHSGARHGKLSSHEHSSDTYGLHCVQILRGTCSLLSCIDHDVSFYSRRLSSTAVNISMGGFFTVYDQIPKHTYRGRKVCVCMGVWHHSA